MYEMIKVFDYYEIPADIQKLIESTGLYSYDSYSYYHVNAMIEYGDEPDDYEDGYYEKIQLLDKWFLANSCVDQERILIKF